MTQVSTVDIPELILCERWDEEGKAYFCVKWLGCDVEQTTWESEKHLRREWPDLLDKYQSEKRTAEPASYADTAHVLDKKKELSSWEDEIEKIVYVERSRLPGLLVYIQWKDGAQTVHHSSEVYEKCPQKMLDYFEQYAHYRLI
ncbi:hypothetical protein BDB01DRAFT_802132 [Pilobolus umbonatus]|nr:hypothetical protein BDB01DRAFT_802132 [Pilobolus umbonatus]